MSLFRYIFFVLILFSFQKVHAQESLITYHFENGINEKYPFLPDQIYEEITLGKTEINTESYHLKGPVKSITSTETKYYFEEESTRDVHSITELSFNQAKQIIYFKHIPREDCYEIEKYIYEHKKLSERIKKVKEYSDSSLAAYKYDNLGYLAEVDYHYEGESFNKDENYRHKIEYAWFDSNFFIQYQYFSITQWSGELQELYNREFEFRFDEKGNVNNAFEITYDSLSRPVYYYIKNNCGESPGLCAYVSTEFDERGNIIKQTVDDVTFSSGWKSYSSFFKAEYDENNLLIWKESYYKLNNYSENETQLQDNIVHEHHEYTLDEYGNWTTLKVYVEGKNNENMLVKTIERNIKYYDE